ncbi:RNA N6-adenosine-methyltransferase mettl16 isoform X2 [Galleria mellonella]|uniref:U6 small nuclear RNA (adenine-(43)-N(6))-methyltransferase n=1 Tax=Galleria mellonella TaxID=7137 RepID=A0A6J3C4U7_GALME|nr:RNA N6-adenosine-methyltransferase mettl16 isoform X2 [Galleria mellonella]
MAAPPYYNADIENTLLKIRLYGSVPLPFPEWGGGDRLNYYYYFFVFIFYIPEDRLVPTLPLRLNYILWIEDLLNAIEKINNIWGLDIGTGACAVYPLLAARKNKWHMIGTETDDISFQKAEENVKRNHLQDLIEVRKNLTSSVIEQLFEDEFKQVFDFSMCNPPFYSSVQELCESRSPARLPPKNGFTGSPQELITEGGELQFCRKYLKESKIYKDKVLIYTTMVGHKYNLKELLQDLKLEGITHTYTEFCQGRVTRWGLAWTYQDFDIFQLVPPRDQPRKKHAPIVYLLPQIPNIPYNVDNVINKLIIILNTLNIYHKVLNKRGNNIILDVTATTNTWSNQRRKRRLMKKLETNDCKKTKIDHTEYTTSSTEDSNSNETLNETNHFEKSIHATLKDEDNDLKPHTSSNDKETVPVIEPIVHAILKVLKKENDILMEMEYLDGSAGKEGLHQIVQYIKNNWK